MGGSLQDTKEMLDALLGHSSQLLLPYLENKNTNVHVGAQPCPTLCNSTESGPPGSSVHRILQARILEQVAISFSRVSS